ncbi:MAG: hypothetical protein PHO62_02520 [Sulfurimonas sp.]|uniref:hypothetical protein n=1 Tax=Sulfurimonas sp. TaxID=2022749 RepID=UPI00262D0F8F|nr:hypothetical protein [Sulfurimonas sp.]MDD5372281.1 hypothetical protein [Sulfurimonas sp.]
MLRGFGKNYFTLGAIQAYSANVKLHAISCAYLHILSNPLLCKKQEQEDEPPTLLESVLLLQNDKPCHCNLFFKLKIRLILLLNHFIPRCPYYTTYFAFRRTGVHPPL